MWHAQTGRSFDRLFGDRLQLEISCYFWITSILAYDACNIKFLISKLIYSSLFAVRLWIVCNFICHAPMVLRQYHLRMARGSTTASRSLADNNSCSVVVQELNSQMVVSWTHWIRAGSQNLGRNVTFTTTSQRCCFLLVFCFKAFSCS